MEDVSCWIADWKLLAKLRSEFKGTVLESSAGLIVGSFTGAVPETGAAGQVGGDTSKPSANKSTGFGGS